MSPARKKPEPEVEPDVVLVEPEPEPAGMGHEFTYPDPLEPDGHMMEEQ